MVLLLKQIRDLSSPQAKDRESTYVDDLPLLLGLCRKNLSRLLYLRRTYLALQSFARDAMN
jgi:hypothetical protein